MIERIRYGGVSNPYNYSEFTCDTAADIADLPTNKDIGKYKNLDTCSIGSKATVISDRTMYILNGNNQWVLLKDYKATGGGSSILIDETLTESGQAADAKAVGDKIAEVKESAHTHSNKDVLDEITSNKITAWDGYSTEIQTVKDGLAGKKDSSSKDSTGEIFNSYENDYKNIASGKYSHAEGEMTTASGNCSHAEGGGGKASGDWSHVEGRGCNALGLHSHAEGGFTTAYSSNSHAEGYYTKAKGYQSHAEGNYTIANGYQSHAEGNYTVAASDHQHVQGKYNKEDSASKYAFIIGNGTDENNRSNAFAIDWDGKIYIGNDTDGVDVSALAITIAELQSQLSRKTIQFRHGKGTFTATANGTNITWQYGGQQVQGGSCTFDVKSDNGLICMDFDSITSLSIQNDATNKMNLSDLGGKITNTLRLDGCANVTGDLSDLGGKITNWLRLNGCVNITGDLSDLGGKITNTLNLAGCANVTGDLSDLGGKITDTLSLGNCVNITGSLSDLGGKITSWLNLDGCTNITGDLSDLGGKISSTLSLSNCTNITGVYTGTAYPKTFTVSKTSITPADMDANLINFAASGVRSGRFAADGMKRTAASDDAVATLVANGWTVSGLKKEG